MSRTDDTYLKQLQARYRQASKNEKTVIGIYLMEKNRNDTKKEMMIEH